jgi:geranylgeranyl pyrophosphate synthase
MLPTTPAVTLDVAVAPAAVRAFVGSCAAAVDAELTRRLQVRAPDPGRLQEAMLYAATGGGKRLRPAVALATVRALGGEGIAEPRAMCVAASIEMLHAYTLVHDDLPAMDDDDERRGRPTVHIAFGEAIAILAGDGLGTLAMQTLGELGIDAGRALRVMGHRTGAMQLLAGQAIDLSMRKQDMTFAQLTDLHRKKTGALFAAAAELGAIAAGANDDIAAAFGDYGMAIGVAFQHADDRDDGEFVHFSAQASTEIDTLCATAVAIVEQQAVAARRRGLHPQPELLMQIAQWIGSKR